VAGKIPVIEIYDDSKMERICELKSIGGSKGHTNRIFCVKFDPLMANVVYSGGWDCIVNAWDLRNGKVIGNINGPQIVGDAIDVNSENR